MKVGWVTQTNATINGHRVDYDIRCIGWFRGRIQKECTLSAMDRILVIDERFVPREFLVALEPQRSDHLTLTLPAESE